VGDAVHDECISYLRLSDSEISRAPMSVNIITRFSGFLAGFVCVLCPVNFAWTTEERNGLFFLDEVEIIM